MHKGDIVIYNGKTYTVIWIYDTGFLELKGDYKIQLVHKDEVRRVS
ncbi:hypothetical protein [Alkalihalobacillus sp. AL-G]|nr:hypothetical protein [Alkalihalobacillus sp. AL-G]WLD94281.1 hypothetical protein MOJ78_05145 [Alkalihalobacillus sp. AL-G]